ncbi:DUF1508 domain-containing protein [Chloroflexota bacterium]|nr:DUF1508 domain-containing protein [Chloroflexota bacterium]
MEKFEIRRASNNQYYWVFVAANGEDICNSETYTAKQSAINSITLVKEKAKTAPIIDKS